MRRNEHGFTLIELLVVLVILGILVAVAIGFQASARNRASDATAEANIRSAVPAIHAYYEDNGTYVGMTVAGLQSAYDKGVDGITIVAARASDYCVSSTMNGRTWYKLGPAGAVTTTACS